MRNVFCSPCGVILQVIEDTYRPNDHLLWIQEIRAVYLKSGLSAAMLSGLGYLNDQLELEAPDNEDASYYQEDVHLGVWPLCQPASEGWVFPFHDACWHLLLSRTGCTHHSKAGQLVDSVFNILYCMPLNRHWTLIPGHDYGGAEEIQQPYGNITRLMQRDLRFGYFMADPLEPFPQELAQRVDIAVDASSFTNPRPSQSNLHDELARLPDEIIIIILTFLPSKDVCQLRLSSRHVARITGPKQLPQSFWASRFQPGFEMDFVFACLPLPEPKGNWQNLYLAAKSAAWGDHSVPSYKNKRRIWHSLSQISQLISRDLHSTLHLGTESASNLSGSMTVSPPCRTFGTVVSGAMLTEADVKEPLRIGSRRLWAQQLLWAANQGVAGCDVGVSFFQYGACRYISGIRIPLASTDAKQSPYFAVGRIIQSTEEWVHGISFNDIKAITVAADVSGILGLRFRTQLESAGSQTVGDLDTSRCGVGVAELDGSEEWKIIGISVGFDAFKAVSIQLIGCHHGNYDNQAPVPANTIPPSDPQYVTLWSPCLPVQVNNTVCIPSAIRNRTFNLCLNMNFGGATGGLLGSLQRITTVMFDRGSEFLGFKFFYSDSTRFIAGRRDLGVGGLKGGPVLEVSFLIASHYGERVSQLEVLHWPWDDGGTVLAVKIHTSWDNDKIFSFNDEYGRQRHDNAVWRTLKPLEGDVITGFVALTRPSSGTFQTFGIQTMKGKSYSDSPRFQRRLSSQEIYGTDESTGSFILNGRGCVIVQARLCNVRQIKLSSGAPGYCRLSEHVSGLWIEYYDQEQPETLGQWMSELVCWEFNKGEKFTNISFWITAEVENVSKAKLGKAIGIRVKTEESTYQQYMGNLDGTIEVNFRANPCEELSAINWTFNVDHDHPRILYGPSSKMSDFELVAFDAHPSWMVPKKVLWRDCDSQGIESTLRSIAISYDSSGVSGISCRYCSGFSHVLGVISGETASLDIEVAEQLTRIDVEHGYKSKLCAITLSTNRGKSLRAGRKQPSAKSSYSIHPSCNPRHSNTLSDNIFAFPPGFEQFAGFWGIERRSDRTLSSLGPVFLKRNQTGDQDMEL